MKTTRTKSKNKGGLEHQEKYEKRSEKSFMHAHQVECHDRALADFTTKVRGTYKDPLSMDLSLLNLKEMQAWLGERNQMELERKHEKNMAFNSSGETRYVSQSIGMRRNAPYVPGHEVK